MRKHIAVVAAVATMLSLSLGAGCGAKKRHRCEATSTYAGRDVTGTGTDFDSEKVAQTNAITSVCQDYCMAHDPAVEAEVQKVTGGTKQDHVARLNTVANPPVKPTFDACTATCVPQINKNVGFRCAYSGI